MAPKAILNIIKDGETVKTCPIEGEVLLGRAEGCAIRLNDRAISRQHALFRWVGDKIQVEKKSEFAPLSVNGAESARALLKEGDLISIGPYHVKIEIEAPVKEENANSSELPSEPLEPKNALPTDSAALPLVEDQNLGNLSDIPSDLNPSEPAPDMGSEASQSNENGAGGEASQGEGGQEQDFEAGQAMNSEQGESSFPPAEVSEPIDEDGKTKLTPAAKVGVKLIFKSGDANYTEYELTKDEISIGRGKNCDIILNDKKSSRKNSIIRRAGLNFMIKDLGSANGTFVNGVKIEEQELSGEDTILIGGIEFQFKVLSLDYSSKEKDFMSLLPDMAEVPDLPEMGQLAAPGSDPFSQPPMDIGQNPGAASGGLPFDPSLGQQGMSNLASGSASMGTGEVGSIPGITGLSGTQKNRTLVEKFKALPRRTQVIALVVAALGLWMLFQDDEPPAVTSGKKAGTPTKAAAVTAPTGMKGPVTFETLSPEQKQFVESQHNLAFDYFKNKDYDKAVFEIQKIFTLINDYKDSREIERYAKEGKRQMEAIEDERRKKEEEAKLKGKIAQLVEETRQRMDKKQYDQAKELFSQVLALDPDNASIAAWHKDIDAYEDQVRIEQQQKQVQVEIDKQAVAIFNEAMDLKKQRKYHSAIEIFQRVSDVGSSDKKLIMSAKKMIANCHAAIRNLRDPALQEAKTLEDAGEFSKAFALYQKATRIDPPHPAGYAGINRIKGILHDRAKVIYTEAILAESYSDFAVAKKLFTECVEIAPVDDVYHEKAQRRLAHYFKKEEAPPQ